MHPVTITATDGRSRRSPLGDGHAHPGGRHRGERRRAALAELILADGSSTTVATATVKDAAGHLLQGDKVSFGSSDGGQKIGAVTDHGDGTYTATITSSDTVGSAKITVTDSTFPNGVSGTATLTQTLGPAHSVSLVLSPTSIYADGVSTTLATATVKDAEGHPLAANQMGSRRPTRTCGSDP